jgi:hypothetical protein
MSTSGLVEVRIVGLPLEIYRRAGEQTDELLREFALINARRPGGEQAVTARLLSLAKELAVRFSGFTVDTDSALAAALERGDTTIDLVYIVPRDAAEASRTLGDLFDEADAYCRAGDELLTLASSEETVAFRRWFLGEFIGQIAGAGPRPWAGPTG